MKLASVTETRIRCPNCERVYLGFVLGTTFQFVHKGGEVCIDLSYGGAFLIKCPACEWVETFTP